MPEIFLIFSLNQKQVKTKRSLPAGESEGLLCKRIQTVYQTAQTNLHPLNFAAVALATRLFKQLLEALEEDFSGLPFIGILNKMEKLNLLENAKDWVKLRQTRNNVAHEYPFYKEVQIEELNLLPDEVLRLEQIWKKPEAYTQKILKEKTTEN
jgi:hypothetical protein